MIVTRAMSRMGPAAAGRARKAALSGALMSASNVRRGSTLGGIGAAMNAGPINTNAAEAVSRSSRFGTWARNRPTWQKYAAGGTVGIVGAKAVFGGRNNNGTAYGY